MHEAVTSEIDMHNMLSGQSNTGTETEQTKLVHVV